MSCRSQRACGVHSCCASCVGKSKPSFSSRAPSPEPTRLRPGGAERSKHSPGALFSAFLLRPANQGLGFQCKDGGGPRPSLQAAHSAGPQVLPISPLRGLPSKTHSLLLRSPQNSFPPNTRTSSHIPDSCSTRNSGSLSFPSPTKTLTFLPPYPSPPFSVRSEDRTHHTPHTVLRPRHPAGWDGAVPSNLRCTLTLAPFCLRKPFLRPPPL